MVKQPQYGVCRLCRTTGELRHSHVIPEFFFRYTYDEKRRGLKVSGFDEAEIVQKGHREYLLCGACEARFNKYETYVARRWHHDFPQKVEGEFFHFRGLDYPSFKLLMLSIIWRAGVAEDEFFDEVQLGPHEEKIRLMLLNDDPGDPDTYAFIPIIQHLDLEIVHTIDKPIVKKEGPFTCYRLVFGGVVWHYLVSSQPARKYSNFPYFSEAGVLLLGTDDIMRGAMMQAFAKKLRQLSR